MTVARWHWVERAGYLRDMTTTPNEPSPDPTVVPSGDPSPDSTPDPEPEEDPGAAPAPEVEPSAT